MLDTSLAPFLNQRKSTHLFSRADALNDTEAETIASLFAGTVPLFPSIKTAFKLVERKDTTCKSGSHCALIFSEVKPGYLQNVGYMGEQLDLMASAAGFKTCWLGIASTDVPAPAGMQFAIMMAFGSNGSLRTQPEQFKRRALEEIWTGGVYENAGELAHLAPSAMNRQPWRIEASRTRIEQYCIDRKSLVLTAKQRTRYAHIDSGIMTCFIELALGKEALPFALEAHPLPLPADCAGCAQMNAATFVLNV